MCFKLFPNPSALETHFQNDHTKDSAVDVTASAAATTTMTSSSSAVALAASNSTTTSTATTAATNANDNNNSVANDSMTIKNCDTESSGTPTYNKVSDKNIIISSYEYPTKNFKVLFGFKKLLKQNLIDI